MLRRIVLKGKVYFYDDSEPLVLYDSLEGYVKAYPKSINEALYTGPLFGLELTFTNEGLLKLRLKSQEGKSKSEYNKSKEKDTVERCLFQMLEQIQNAWLDGVKKLVEDKKIGTVEGTKVLFIDAPPYCGWWYEVTVDDLCIELKTRPMTLKVARMIQSVIQEYIFDFAKMLKLVADGGSQKLQINGLLPDRTLGSGHIHMDICSAFGGKHIKFLNFMTEIHNLGCFPFLDMFMAQTTAPPLSISKQNVRQYKKIVSEVKRGGLKKIGVLVREIETKVYCREFNNNIGSEHDSSKFQTISLQRVRTQLDFEAYEEIKEKLDDKKTDKKDKLKLRVDLQDLLENALKGQTLEIRAFRAQTSALEIVQLFDMLIRLLQIADTEEVAELTLDPEALLVTCKPKEFMTVTFEQADEIALRVVSLFGRLGLDVIDFLHMFPAKLGAAVKFWASRVEFKKVSPKVNPLKDLDLDLEGRKKKIKERRERLRIQCNRLERMFVIGHATGVNFNCLIDTVYQLANGKDSSDLEKLDEIRDNLVMSGLTVPGSMLDLDDEVGAQLADAFKIRLRVITYVDGKLVLDPRVFGSGGPIRYVLHMGAHFMPLWLRHGLQLFPDSLIQRALDEGTFTIDFPPTKGG